MVSRAAQLAVNKVEGNQLEAIFERIVRLQGFGIRKNPISGEWKYDGVFRPIDSELDWTVCRDGKTAFFDTKSFQSDFFSLSELKGTQVDRAAWYNEFRVPAGFVIWFRPINKVVFFSGAKIAAKGERSAFHWQEGLLLGTYENFDLRLVVGPNGFAG